MRRAPAFGYILIALAICAVTAASFWCGYKKHADTSVVNASEVEVAPAQPAISPAPVFLQPAATILDADLLGLARKVIAVSPAQAMRWVNLQPNSVLRQKMLLAVLRAWGERDPASVVDWVLAQDEATRDADMRAAMTGAASQPEVAMQVARTLLTRDPDSGGAYAGMLAGALCANGDFQKTLQFINGEPADAMGDSVRVAFNAWAQGHPQDALDAVDAIADPQLRTTAFQTAVAAWNASDPGGLAAHAAAMPAGADRTYALNAAMADWCVQDPATMADWLNTLPPGPEFDAGAAMMIAQSDGANRPPETAMEWVENIRDPGLQQDSLKRVLNEWNQSDPAAARQYVSNATWLGNAQKQVLLAKLGAGE